MEYDEPLSPGRLRRRYKRFLADVTLDSGVEIIAHCPNTGRMSATESNADTNGSSVVPGLVKQTSMPFWAAVLSKISAPFMLFLPDFS